MTQFDFRKLQHFSVYLIGGLISAAIDILVIKGLLTLDYPISISVTVGFLAGLIVNYSYHAIFTFKTAFSLIGFSKYLVVVFFNYLLTLLFVYVSADTLGYGVIVGKVLSLPVVAINGFIFGKIWIFKNTNYNG